MSSVDVSACPAGSSEGVTWAEVFALALRDGGCRVHGLADEPLALPVGMWRERAGESDRAVLDHCTSPTLDLGCGPGRLTAELARSGRHALGIDLVGDAVEQTRARGVLALRRDIFGSLPGEGRWACALLADGNVGIGGDPVRLLTRVRALLADEGRAVVDLAPPGHGLRTCTLSLERHGIRSEPFPWSVLGPESIHDVSARSGFSRVDVHEYDGRWFAVLHAGRST